MMRSLRLSPPVLTSVGSLSLLVTVACGGTAIENVGGAQGAGGSAAGGTSSGGNVSSGGSTTFECVRDADCADTDPCFARRCQENECVEISVADDGDPCTDDYCTRGEITHLYVADDGDPCTLDLCDENGVVENVSLADDGDACTDDFCDPELGVYHLLTNVDDGDACTVDTCDPLVGVQNVPLDVDDGDLCTVDECDSMSGPTHQPVMCPSDACGNATCDAAIGCQIVPEPGCCVNLAPSATPTMSAGGQDGAGYYGPSQLNDGVTQADTCNKFAWISNGATPSPGPDVPYFQLTWQSPVTVQEIYVDTLKSTGEACKTTTGRNLKGAKVQYWTGSSWATSTTIENRADDFGLTLPNPVTTTALRLYDVTAGGNGGNTLVYEWYVYPASGCTP